MSSIADREAWRTGRPVSRPTGWRIELVFWLVLLAMAAVMIAAAVAGAGSTFRDVSGRPVIAGRRASQVDVLYASAAKSSSASTTDRSRTLWRPISP